MSDATLAPPTTAAVNKAVLVNRLTGALAWAGVFVASVLTYSHLTGKSVPCGPSHGCDTVAQHEASRWFGVPVAVIGLIGYLILVGLSVARPMMGRAKWRFLTNVSVAGTLFGFFASVYFMFTSFAVIQAKCEWCIASAVIMTLSLIATGWLWSLDPPDVRPATGDSLTHFGGAVVALGLAGVVISGLDRSMDDLGAVKIGNLTIAQILPADSKVRGPKDAPVTIVEFADFNCPSCRSSAPIIDRVFKGSNNKIRWGFRNMPLVKLKGHETSMHAATLSELAARKGLFWDFFDSAYKEENTERVKSVEGVKQVAMDTGLKADDVTKALDPSSPEATAVIADMNFAHEMGVLSTPTFLILANGQEPRAVTGRRLEEVLNEPAYRRLLGR